MSFRGFLAKQHLSFHPLSVFTTLSSLLACPLLIWKLLAIGSICLVHHCGLQVSNGAWHTGEAPDTSGECLPESCLGTFLLWLPLFHYKDFKTAL